MTSETMAKRAPRTGTDFSYYCLTVAVVAFLSLFLWGMDRTPTIKSSPPVKKHVNGIVFTRHELSRSQDQYTVTYNGDRVASSWLLNQLATSAEHRATFIATLNASRFDTFRYESPPISTSDDPLAEFILLDAPHLKGIRADVDTFAEHFKPNTTVSKFLNLGGSSTLIAPVPLENKAAYRYSSLGPFIKRSTLQSEKNQVDEIIRTVADEGLAALDKHHKTYISTEGSGVYWLHVRFDPRPKYYSSQYRQL